MPNFFIRVIVSGCLLALSATLAAGESLTTTTAPVIYHDGWNDLNKNGKQDPYETAGVPVDARVADLLKQMTVEEKTCQLATLYGYKRYLKDPLPTAGWKDEVWKDGIANIDEMHNGIGLGRNGKDPDAWPPSVHVKALNEVQRWFIEQTRLGIPVDFTNEGVRGLSSINTTDFPAPIGLGATWDRDLISRVGKVVGSEARAWGYTNVYAPVADLARDPRWGRVMDCFGEEPYLVAEMAVAQTLAMQKQGIAATAKHFAVHSEPKGGRDGVNRSDPHIAPREMRMLHLYPWERLVREAGLLGAMVSYNDYDGIPIAGSHEFMIDLLRKEWGFKGYLVSDSGAVENLAKKHRVAAAGEDAAAMYVAEGGNVRTMFNSPDKFILPLRQAITDGKLTMADLDARVADVLRVKFILGLFDHPYADPTTADAANHTPESEALALRAAHESIVLLKNANGTLPLSKSAAKRILVCGPAADSAETSISRYGSRGNHVVTLLEGIRHAVGDGGQVDYLPGSTGVDANWPASELDYEPPAGKDAKMIQDAVAAAAAADVIILGLGDTNQTIGEAKSRTSLDLPGYQTDLAKALVKTGKPVIVVLMTGRPASANWVDAHAAAVLEAWFPGEAGGTAIADVLFGDYNPGGKLTVTFPRTVGQLPFNFPYKPSSQDPGSAKESYNGTSGPLIDSPLYPFGYGLSYTTFEYSNLTIDPPAAQKGIISVRVDIKNTGHLAGDEIVQLYTHQMLGSVTTYDMNLRGFQRISLQPGEARHLTFELPVASLAIVTRSGEMAVEPGVFGIWLGSSSVDVRLKGTFTVAADAASKPPL